MKILEEINKAIQYYREHYNTMTIVNLLDCKSRILTLCYNIAEELSDIKTQYNKAYFIRQINFFKDKNSYINQKKSAAAAESMAKENSEQNLKTELQYENIAYRLEKVLKQANMIADDIKQRISVLKKEQEY